MKILSIDVRKTETGFSIYELVIVVVIIGILSAVSIIGFGTFKKYAADDQAINALDLLQEARQKAMNERETMRVEFNDTKKELRLIDENVQSDVSDDVIVRTVKFSSRIVVGTKPAGLTTVPSANYPIDEISYTQSTYPLSATNDTFTLRFLKNGQVVDKGNNNIGTGAVMRGATIYVYSLKEGSNSPDIIRAITVSGITGDVTILKCIKSGNNCSAWKR